MLGADCLKYVFGFFVLCAVATMVACAAETPKAESSQAPTTAKCREPDGSVTEYASIDHYYISTGYVTLYPSGSSDKISYSWNNCTVVTPR